MRRAAVRLKKSPSHPKVSAQESGSHPKSRDERWAKLQQDMDDLDSMPTVALHSSDGYPDLCGEDAPTAHWAGSGASPVARDYFTADRPLPPSRPQSESSIPVIIAPEAELPELPPAPIAAAPSIPQPPPSIPPPSPSLAPMAMDAYGSTPSEGTPLPEKIRAPWDFDTFRLRFDPREIFARRVIMFTGGFAIVGILMLAFAGISFATRRAPRITLASQAAMQELPSAVNLGVPIATSPQMIPLAPSAGLAASDTSAVVAPKPAAIPGASRTTIAPPLRHPPIVARVAAQPPAPPKPPVAQPPAPPKPPVAQPPAAKPGPAPSAKSTDESQKALDDAKRETEGSLN